MSATVLRPGIRYRGKCRQCLCLFEVTRNEITDEDPTFIPADLSLAIPQLAINPEPAPTEDGDDLTEQTTPVTSDYHPECRLRHAAPCPECGNNTWVVRTPTKAQTIEDAIYRHVTQEPLPHEVIMLAQGWGNTLEARALPDDYDIENTINRHIHYTEGNLARIISLARCLNLPTEINPCEDKQPRPPVTERPPFLLLQRFQGLHTTPEAQDPAAPAAQPSTPEPPHTAAPPAPATAPSTHTPEPTRHTDGTDATPGHIPGIPDDTAATVQTTGAYPNYGPCPGLPMPSARRRKPKAHPPVKAPAPCAPCPPASESAIPGSIPPTTHPDAYNAV